MFLKSIALQIHVLLKATYPNVKCLIESEYLRHIIKVELRFYLILSTAAAAASKVSVEGKLFYAYIMCGKLLVTAKRKINAKSG